MDMEFARRPDDGTIDLLMVWKDSHPFEDSIPVPVAQLFIQIEKYWRVKSCQVAAVALGQADIIYDRYMADELAGEE
jgi:hypothetical protein